MTRHGCRHAAFNAALDTSSAALDAFIMRRAGVYHATSHAASNAVFDASSTRRGWRHAASSAELDAASMRRGWLHATVSAAEEAVRSSSDVDVRLAGKPGAFSFEDPGQTQHSSNRCTQER